MSKYPINILLKSIKIYLNPLNIMKTPIESHVWLELYRCFENAILNRPQVVTSLALLPS